MALLDAHSGISIRQQQRFRASRDQVFRAWTDPAVLKEWWCPDGWTPAEIEMDVRVGGSYRIGMRRLQGGKPVYIHGCFLDVHAPERLVYTWKWINAFADMPETCVTVEFFERDGVTELVLSHENLPEISICLRHWRGWNAAWKRIHATIGNGGRQ